MNETLSWSAAEHEHQQHSQDWYWVVGIITVSLAIAFFILNNSLLSIILILGISILMVHTKTPPKILSYEISRKGVRAGKTLYLWDTLDSFWIQERTEKDKDFITSKLLLTSKKPLMPHIVIPISDSIDLEDLHAILSNKLEEVYQIEPLPDRIMRTLGF